MALPTWSQVWQQISDTVKLHEDQRSAFAGTYLTQENVVSAGTNLQSFNAAALQDGVAKQRARLDSFLQAERACLDPLFLELARIMKTPDSDVASTLLRLTTYMVDNPDSITPGPPRVASRQILRGAFTPGTPFVGSGTIYRLFVDPFGNCLEGGFSDVISVRCTSDRQSGADPGREQFEFRGRPRPDTVTYYTSGFGSGIGARISAISADDSVALVLNPSFADYSGTTAVPTALTNWEFYDGVSAWSSTAANVKIDQTYYYRAALLESTAASVAFTGTQKIRQRFSVRRATLSSVAPYYVQIAWRADAGASPFVGSFILKLGTSSVTVTVSGQTGWQVAQLALDKNLYLRNFDTDDAALQIEVTRSSGTQLNMDDLVAAPFRPYDGHWVAIVGGVTPFLYYDTGTFTDTELGSKIQRHVQRCYGYSLPSKPVAPSVAPVAAVSATAGAITAGTHVFAYSWVDTQGVESAPSPISNAPTFDGTKKADLTGIAVGGSNIVDRKLYASKAGTTAPLYYIEAMGNNSGTTKTTGVADGSLTVASDSGVTISDPS